MTSPLRGTHLKLEGLRKSFGTQAALRGIDLAVMPRESVQLWVATNAARVQCCARSPDC
jgi:ABC-type sugar transport system ATPase subunit